jgi:predicted GNAT family acetyltransferase
MSLTVHHHATGDEFLAVAGGFLGAREAEHNLLFGITSAVRVTPELFAEDPPRFATVTDAGGRVVAATLRTPPYNQVLSSVDDPATVDPLVDALRDDPLPGVLGPTDAAARFAARWTEATGQAAHVQMAERIFRLERVIAPLRPASGSWRMAEPRDRDLLARWLVEFATEATPDAAPLPDATAAADRWIARRGRVAYLWEDGDDVVSWVGAGGETPHGIRIGPVYTPPPMRARGYASSLTAAASAHQLEHGRRFCFLFTDLANPTSNKIYRAIGYEPVCDVDQYRFVTDA